MKRIVFWARHRALLWSASAGMFPHGYFLFMWIAFPDSVLMEVWQLSLLSCFGCICVFISCYWVLLSTVFCNRLFPFCMARLKANTQNIGKRKKAVDILSRILYDKSIWKALKVLVEMHGSRRERRSPAESLLVYVCRSNFSPEQLCWTEILLTRQRRERTLRVLSALQTEAENLGGTADLIRPWYNIRGFF